MKDSFKNIYSLNIKIILLDFKKKLKNNLKLCIKLKIKNPINNFKKILSKNQTI